MAYTEDEILRLAADRFRFAQTEDLSERTLADEDLRFAWNYEGAQWDSTVRSQREGQYPPRPCLVINKITEKIDLIEGEFRQLAPSFKIRAVDSMGDPQVAQVISGMVRHIEANSVAKTAYNTAYTSVLYAGRGAWRINVKDCKENPFVRELALGRIPNVFSLYIDPEAKELVKSDMKFAFITEEILEEEFKRQYGEEQVMDWPSDSLWEGWKSEKGVRIAEYWYTDYKKTKYYLVNRNGIPTAVTAADPFDEILDEKMVEEPAIKWCKLTAGKILGKIEDFPGEWIPIIYVPGKEINIHGSAKTRGMTRYAKSPQQMYNYWASNNTELIALAPKAPYLVTPAMISKHQDQWDKAHIRNYTYLFYEGDPLFPSLMPRREPPPQLSTAMEAERARTEHDINASMGLHEPSLGQPSQERSGRAILARQSRGSLGAYTYIDNFQTALEHSTRVIIGLIPYVYDTQRIVRIVGEDEETYNVPINASPQMPMAGVSPNMPPEMVTGPRPGVTELVNDLTVGKYDVVVTVGPSYATLREETLAMMTELMKVAPPQFIVELFDLMIDSMDMPRADKFKARIKALRETPPPPDPKLQIELEKLALQMRKQMREEFDSHFKAILSTAQAEGVEAGQQLQQYTTYVDAYMREKELEAQRQQAQQQQKQAG